QVSTFLNLRSIPDFVLLRICLVSVNKKIRRSEMTCKEVMIPNPRCCTIFANAREAAEIMYEDNVGVVPVIDEATQILIETVTERDLCLEVVAKGENPKEL